MSKENNITDLSKYREEKERGKKMGGYKIDIQAEAARFEEKLPDLIERRSKEAARVGEGFPTEDQLMNIDDGYGDREERDTQAVLSFCKTGMFRRIMELE